MIRPETDDYGKRYLWCQIALEPLIKARAELLAKCSSLVVSMPIATKSIEVTMELTPQAEELDNQLKQQMNEVWSHYFPEQKTFNDDDK